MSLDNGAIPAATDEIDTDPNLPSVAPVAESDQEDDSEPELDDEGNPVERKPVEPEWAEIEIDGKKYKVEAAAKDGYLRQSDYTRKTQEVAEAKRALEAEREGFTKQTEAQKAHFQTATKLAALDERLEEYKKVDWQTLYQTNPDLYQQHRINYDALKDQRDAVARDYSQKEQERQTNEQRETAKRVSDAYAAIERFVPAWKPNSEFESKIFAYGNELGLKTDVLARAIIQEPVFARELARLHAYDEAAKKQKTQATFQASQEAKPVTRVGGNSGAPVRKTTDPSGDKLSTEEWARRERERVAKLRQA